MRTKSGAAQSQPRRLFVALWPPRALQSRLWRSLEPLRAELPRVRWVPPERYHLTLRFLGDVPARAVAAVVRACDALVSVRAFRVRLAGAGAFPPRGRPRIYWVGVEAESLTGLRKRLDGALAAEGFPRERKRFAAHLTIGRAGRERSRSRPSDPPRPAAALARFRGVRHGDFALRAVHLVQSELRPSGPVYTSIHAVSLAPPAAP